MLTVCSVATAVAQATLKGKVVDAETKEPLIGATVAVSVNPVHDMIDPSFTCDHGKMILLFGLCI